MLEKILRENDLDLMTMRKVMNAPCVHFGVALEILSVRKEFVRSSIETFLKCGHAYQPYSGPKIRTEEDFAPVLTNMLREYNLDLMTLRKVVNARFPITFASQWRLSRCARSTYVSKSRSLLRTRISRAFEMAGSARRRMMLIRRCRKLGNTKNQYKFSTTVNGFF